MGVIMARAKNFKTLYQWCIENDNDNLLLNWDYEKNGDITPHNIARRSKVFVHFKCHVCGREYATNICNIRVKKGCGYCKGNPNIGMGGDGKYIVYCHLLPNGKRYIGMTRMLLCNRFNPSLYAGRFRAAINEFGWKNIEHIVLEKGLTREEASDKEVYYINYYNTLDERYGYNICSGGIHGGRPIVHSEETKRKIALTNTGKKRSLETRLKLSLAHKGKQGNNVRPIYKKDKDGNILEEYSSVKEAAIKNKCNYSSLYACVSGKRKIYIGYLWEFKSIRRR